MTPYVVYELENFITIMQTSQGRDKIFAIIQQCVDLYVKCNKFRLESSPVNHVYIESNTVR